MGSTTGRHIPLLSDRNGATAAVDARVVYKELVAGEYICSIPTEQSDVIESLEVRKYGLEGSVM